MKKNSRFLVLKLRLLPILLCFCMLLGSVPIHALDFAAEENEAPKPTFESDAVICAEYDAKRGEFEKHFLLSDGSFVAASYSEAVHVLKDGKWEEIDLSWKQDRADSRYTAASGAFSASFSGKESGGELVQMGSEDHFLSWSLVLNRQNGEKGPSFSAKNAEIQIDSGASSEKKPLAGRKVSEEGAFDLAKTSSRITYSQLFPSYPEIKVEYTVTQNRIEENLFFLEPSKAQTITFAAKKADYSAKLADDGSVVFFDSKGTARFRVGIPYMEDAKGEVLNRIETSIQEDADQILIDYTPDAAWVNSAERAYPILFDPSITTAEYASNLVDTYVTQGDAVNHSSEGRLRYGVKDGKINRAYLKVNQMPHIDASMPILGASIRLTLILGQSTGKTVNFYSVASSWNPSTITFANQPGFLSSNLLGTSPYTSGMTAYNFDITTHVAHLYDQYNAGVNYGYLLRYADESLVNPDYNSVYSIDVTTPTYKPLITVQYGYALPGDLTNGGVYAIQNFGSFRYMTVHNGADQNETNVYQMQASSYSALTSAQKFKLDFVASTGGYYIRAMCSSNGANRVLDIVKSGNYVVSGNNVEIYTPVDSIAQHWFIIGEEDLQFRIVPRTNMSLALTVYPSLANGTSGGRTASSPGNIFVSTYDETNDYQKWMFRDTDGEYITADSPGVLSTDYYLNNMYYGKYLHKSGSAVNAASGLIASLGNTIRWKLIYEGSQKYSIRSLDDPTKYLYGSGTSVSLSAAPSSGGLTDSYKWTVTSGAGGGMLIRSAANNAYLYETSSSLALSSTLGDPGTDAYNKRVWRMASTSFYGNTGASTYRELPSAYYANDLNLDVCEIKPLSINSIYSNVLWASSNDFIISISNTNIAQTTSSNQIEGYNRGNCTVTLTHKVTNITSTQTSDITVKSTFSATMSNLEDLHDAALTYNSTPRDAVLLTLQFIRRLKYNGENWPTVAGVIDTQFVNYISNYYPGLYRYFTVEDGDEHYYYEDPMGEGDIDFCHLCATLNGLIYDSDGFKAALAGEANVDNLCGWAGDLQSLCIDVLRYTNDSDDYDTVYNAAYYLMGHPGYHFSMSDLLADTDSYNINTLLDDSNTFDLIGVFSEYYDDYADERYTLFTNGWTKPQIYNCVRNYTTETFFAFINWPLLDEFSFTATQSNAIAWAFTDYIWEKVQNE